MLSCEGLRMRQYKQAWCSASLYQLGPNMFLALIQVLLICIWLKAADHVVLIPCLEGVICSASLVNCVNESPSGCACITKIDLKLSLRSSVCSGHVASSAMCVEYDLTSLAERRPRLWRVTCI